MPLIKYIGVEQRVSFSPATGESLPGVGHYLDRGVPVDVPEHVADMRCFDNVVVYGRGNTQTTERWPSGDWCRCDPPIV